MSHQHLCRGDTGCPGVSEGRLFGSLQHRWGQGERCTTPRLISGNGGHALARQKLLPSLSQGRRTLKEALLPLSRQLKELKVGFGSMSLLKPGSGWGGAIQGVK